MSGDWSRKPPEVVPPLELKTYSVLDQVTDAAISEIANRLLAAYTHLDGKPIVLSPQELRVALQLGQGMTMKEIGKQMGFRHASDIANRIRNCCRKHGITRPQLAVYGAFLAMRKGDL